jgi:sterol carrier protein 2
LTAPGKAHTLIDSGDNTYGGKFVINPSGGLISKGHPLGATGLAQCSGKRTLYSLKYCSPVSVSDDIFPLELVWQLRNWAGERQVPNAKYALQHNVGLGGAVVITLYKKANDAKSEPRVGYNPVSKSNQCAC